jgi:hypothetical protein
MGVVAAPALLWRVSLYNRNLTFPRANKSHHPKDALLVGYLDIVPFNGESTARARKTSSVGISCISALYCDVRNPSVAMSDHLWSLRGAASLLMFASGVPTAEKPQARKFYLLSHGPNRQEEHSKAWTNYRDYLRSTSILIPMPPFLYRHLPVFIKRTLLLDFPMYQFDEKSDGPRAVEDERTQGPAGRS